MEPNRRIIDTTGAVIVSSSSAVGEKEFEGPLGGCFDFHDPSDRFGQKTFEKSEGKMQRLVLASAIGKLGLKPSDIDALFAGAGYSEELQEHLLLEAVSYDPWSYQEGVLELYEMWCSGDEAALIAYLSEEEDTSEMTEEEIALYEEYWTAMSTDRNAGMLEVAKQYLSGDKLVFFAVGLAHLLAEDGLVNTLRDAGYTVELVVYS